MSIVTRPYFTVTLFEAPIAHLLSEFIGWMNGYKSVEVPLSFPQQRYGKGNDSVDGVFWEPLAYPARTAFFSSISDSRSFYAVNAAERFKHQVIKVRTSAPEDEWSINELLVYKNGELDRLIHVCRDDDRWAFYTNGMPLAFENQVQYRKRRIKDRFDRGLLLRYVKDLGWNLYQEEFWQTSKPAYAIVQDPERNAVKPCPHCGKPLATPRAK